MILSDFGKINWQDILHGFVQAVVVAVLTVVIQALQNGGSISLRAVGIAAIVAGCSFVLQRFGTDSNNKVLGKF